MSGKTSQRLFRIRLDQMVSELRTDILSGKLSPGDYLPSESALAKHFSLSNKSVRQGLDVLVGEGLLRKIPRIGNQVTEAAEKAVTTITLGLNTSIERDMSMSVLLDAFHRRHPGVRVQTMTLPGNARIFAQEHKEGLLDACIVNRQYMQELEESDQLDTLEPLAPAEGVYRFLEEAFTIRGTLYAQPLLFSPIVLCYNKTHFQEAGLEEPDSSWTWEEALAHARQLSRTRSRYGLAFHELSVNRWPVFLLQSGVPFQAGGPGGPSIAEESPMLEGIRLFDRVIHDSDIFPKLLSESNDDISLLFQNGSVSMMLASYMSLNELKEADLAYDISTMPYFAEPRTLTVAFGMFINRHSTKKQAARLLAEFVSSEEGQRIIRRHTLSIPALKAVAESEVIDDLNRPARYQMFRDILPTLRFHHDLNLTGYGLGELWKLLKQYWSRLIDDETLCRQLNERLHEWVRPHSAPRSKISP